MARQTWKRRALLSSVLALMLAACVPPQPTSFYTLSAVMSESSLEAARQEAIIGLGPIDIPDYLDRSEIVTRRDETGLVLADFAKWGEPLGPLFARILREDLIELLGTQQVILLPDRRDNELDEQVEIDVIQFEAVDDKEVVLNARWRLYDRGGRRLVRTEQSLIREPLASPADYDAVAAGMSRAVARLAEDIARAVAKVPSA
jgi:uncharacterized lipoprotein YmbA